MCPKLGVNSSVDIRVIHDNGNDIFIDAEGETVDVGNPYLVF